MEVIHNYAYFHAPNIPMDVMPRKVEEAKRALGWENVPFVRDNIEIDLVVVCDEGGGVELRFDFADFDAEKDRIKPLFIYDLTKSNAAYVLTRYQNQYWDWEIPKEVADLIKGITGQVRETLKEVGLAK